MPASSKKQKAYLGMQYGLKKAGKPTKVKMSTRQFKDFLQSPVKKKK